MNERDELVDTARLVETGERVWLCREEGRMTDWAHGPEDDPHCWFNGARAHNPECGEYLVSKL